MDAFVGRFLVLPGRWESVARELLPVIASIHGWHDSCPLPCVPVETVPDLKHQGFYYHPKRALPFLGKWKEPRIAIAESCKCPHLTFVHEIGHLLDHTRGNFRRFPSATYGSIEHAAVSRVFQTETYRRKEAELDTQALPDKERHQIIYRVSHREVWAQVYAQYITEKSQHPLLMAELEQERKSASKVAHMVWPASEFVPIAILLESVLVCWQAGVA